MTCYVYSLSDPDGFVRYIGKSKDPVRRLAGHVSTRASKSVRAWVLSLGVEPKLSIVGRFESNAEAALVEREEIARLRSQLLNCQRYLDIRHVTRRQKFFGFGSRCAMRRVGLGKNQNEVSQQCGFAVGMLSRIESGDTKYVSAETAVILARALETSVEWLVTGDEHV